MDITEMQENSCIKIKVRPSTGPVFEISLDPAQTTVQELKEKLSARVQTIRADEMRLVYSGRVLKDEEPCEFYSKCYLAQARATTLTRYSDGFTRGHGSFLEPLLRLFKTISCAHCGKQLLDHVFKYYARRCKDQRIRNYILPLQHSGIKEGHTIHLVKTAANKAQEQATVRPTSPTATTAATAQSGATAPSGAPVSVQPTSFGASPLGASPFGGPSPFGGANSFGGASPFGSATGIGGAGGLSGGMPNVDPEMMRQMMESPFMQSILNNPELMRSMMMSNPQIRSMIERNPEVGHIINDPAFLRQSIQMMRNPELMREMQRNNDRALSNIEAIPGGFNHLRRMYHSLQEPMESAARPREASSDEVANERLAQRLGVARPPDNQINTQALPNPWAPPAPNSNTSANAGLPAANPFVGLLGSGSGIGAPAFNPFAFPPSFSSAPTASAFTTPTADTNTPTSTTTPPTSSAATPSSPTSAGGAGSSAPPTPFWMNPDFINVSMRLQQAMQQSMANPQANPQQPMQQQQQQPLNPLWNPFLMPSPMFGFPPYANTAASLAPAASAQPLEPPETRFRTQLQTLEEMGFVERDTNLRALLATGGDVNAAIEYLLSNNL
ncbi:hypothetical protein BC938DRAFT_476741 [Jimgerdemannia flammicorona]|uniref:Ubiquilin n=1 Tax=Jimgerdemannia flammicorona TaxID=994334 RepID=A0A433QQ92_9FUNG|nr:hypothetical protein BC938DRAFT_476741 [Jimgerdemannia flammicorona]